LPAERDECGGLIFAGFFERGGEPQTSDAFELRAAWEWLWFD
jgi:hypothetical protein